MIRAISSREMKLLLQVKCDLAFAINIATNQKIAPAANRKIFTSLIA